MPSTKCVLALLLLLATVIFLVLPVVAQVSSGSISGVVQDAQRAVVPNATVTLINQTQGAVIRSLATSSEGTFVFTPVAPGTYTITVEAPGFKKSTTQDIIVRATERVGLPPIVLEVGAVGESITVEASAVTLQTVSAERSGVVTGSQILEIGSLSRNINDLLKTMPGVTPDTNNVNGTRGDQGTWAIDGVTVTDTGCNCFAYRINTDTIAEFKVLAGGQQAEFGRSSGAAIIMVTKSGTQELHGSGYTYLRNEWMNANSWSNNYYGWPRPLARYRTQGGTVGGPLYIPGKFNTNKDKLFYYVTGEIYRTLAVESLQSRTMPTVLQRKGDFSQTRNASGQPVTIKDPAAGGAPFPGNIIPENRWDPLGVKAINWFPLPNREGINPTFNYQYEFKPKQERNDFTGRLDYNISDKWKFFFRFIRNKNHGYGSGGLGVGANIGVSPFINQETGQISATANLTTIITPTLTNEFNYGNSRNWLPNKPPDDSKYLIKNSGVKLPILYPNADPVGFMAGMRFDGMVNMNPPNWYANGVPYDNENPVVNYTDTIAKVFPKHMVKAGIFIEDALKRQTAYAPSPGTYYFTTDAANPLDTGWDFANLLVGTFQAFEQASVLSKGFYRYYNYEWFVQDNWRVRPSLTLDYGVRFSYLPHTFDEHNQMAGINPGLYNPAKAVKLYQKAINPATGQVAAYNPLTGQYLASTFIGAIIPGSGDMNNGLVQEGKNGYPKGLIDSPGVKVAPRFGLAWTPAGPGGKTVIRVGGGVFYERIVGNVAYYLITNPPTMRMPRYYYGTFNTLTTLPETYFPPAVGGVAKNGKIPDTYNYNVSVQRELPFAMLLDVSYVGTLNRHQTMQVPFNEPAWGSAWLPEFQDPTVTPKYDGTTTLPINFTRPYIGYAGRVSGTFAGHMANFGSSSQYHGLQVGLNRRMYRNVQFGLAYTWSKVLGTSSGYGTWSDLMHPTNIRKADYGPLTFDRTQVLTVNYIIDLPRGARPGTVLDNAVWRTILNGWQVSGITSMSSGAPSSLSWSWAGVSDPVRNRMITGNEDWAPRVVLTGNPNKSPGDRTLYEWINTNVVLPAPKGSQGMESAKNPVRGPGINNWDISLFKRINFGSEQRYLQLRLEMYNAFNHTQWSDVNRSVQFDRTTGKITNLPSALGGSGGRFGFGALGGAYGTSVRSPRNIQVAAKFYF